MGTRQRLDQSRRNRHYVREWRKYRHLTQEQLADRLGVATSTISQLETGKQGYSQAILEALADALSCQPADLLRRDPNKEGEIVDLFDGLTDERRALAVEMLKTLKSA